MLCSFEIVFVTAMLTWVYVTAEKLLLMVLKKTSQRVCILSCAECVSVASLVASRLRL